MPSGFSVILLPTDLVEPPRDAFALARSLAGLNARLIVVHVLEGDASPWSQTQDGADPAAAGSIRVEHTCCRGPAADSIVGLAESLGCELIVIATKPDPEPESPPNDHPRPARRLTGEVAQDILRRAACPVLCLPTTPA